ncbi:MAG: response regulator [Phycisphaerae bacterium]
MNDSHRDLADWSVDDLREEVVRLRQRLQARTLRHRAERVQHRRELEESLKARKERDTFLAMLSHELRTPLSPAILTVDNLCRRGDLPPDLLEQMELVRRNLDVEVRLIDDLLDINRFAAGKIVLRKKPLDVHKLMQEVFEICRSPLQQKQIEIVWDLDAAEHWVEADGTRIQQVLWNLVRNATKFTPEHGQVTLATDNPAEGRLRVQVTDTGIGIRAHDLGEIFEAFVQAEPGKRVAGLGLGLAITKRVIDAHQGKLNAYSPGEGLGSTFSFELATIPAPEERPGDGTVDDAHPIGYMRILLVEDHIESAKVLARILSSDGFDIEYVTTAGRALEVLDEKPFDVVISDLGLPDMSGYELMREIRSRRDLPGIALSGFGTDKDVSESLAAGFNSHLTKPVNLKELDEALTDIAGEIARRGRSQVPA